MKLNKANAISFLRDKLLSTYVIKAFVFGSFVTEKENPSDCDIFIVTNQTPYTNNWKDFLKIVAELKIEFEVNFALPLNTAINTEKEFTEESTFKKRILTKKIVELI